MVQGLLTSCEKTWVIYTIKEINEQIYKIHLFSGAPRRLKNTQAWKKK